MPDDGSEAEAAVFCGCPWLCDRMRHVFASIALYITCPAIHSGFAIAPEKPNRVLSQGQKTAGQSVNQQTCLTAEGAE